MQQVDARGKSCPLPIVLTAKAMKLLAVGESLSVRANDRAFLPDIEAWCKKTGNQLVGVESKDGYFEAVVRRTV